jgi:formate dehydrogenase subunit delta
MSTIDRLVMMANQIAANLSTEANPVAATAEHIRLFWDPRMKSMVMQPNVEGLSPVAKAGIKLLTHTS